MRVSKGSASGHGRSRCVWCCSLSVNERMGAAQLPGDDIPRVVVGGDREDSVLN
jgi:hypothetical protein